jgi:hypothetical protein
MMAFSFFITDGGGSWKHHFPVVVYTTVMYIYSKVLNVDGE